MGRMLLTVDGVFLIVMGGAAAAMEIAGHFFGKGPFGEQMFRSAFTIGGFEAHLLAVLIGVLLIGGARKLDRTLWHHTAAAVHVILGGSNLLFFRDAFGGMDVVGLGVVTTLIHAGFAAAQAALALRSQERVDANV